ncbi:MAG: hypothetical protein RIT81_43965 [Deltaproteobacteria bacterium]
MTQQNLRSAIDDIPSLRGIFLTAMPDCLLYDSWVRDGQEWEAEEVASYFGDLVRANREGLKALRSWSTEMQVTIESADLQLILKELRDDFVVAFAFESDAPLGMVRLHTRRVLARLVETLPKVEVEQRPRAVRILEFLERYAPDPHAVLYRVALRTGIDLDVLKRRGHMEPAQVESLERTVKDILNLEHLAV